MIDKSTQDALNSQMNAEIYSSYLYMSMSAWFESEGLKGAANWMRVQALEEGVHAMKFYNYVRDRGGRVAFAAIEAPPAEWKSPLDCFQAVYAHEQKVTGLINKLVDLAISKSDHATNSFLQWFVTEQVEEEASADELVQKLKLIKDSPQALLMLDTELAARTFVPPVPPVI